MVEKTGNIRADPLKDRPFSDTVLVIGLLTFALLTSVNYQLSASIYYRQFSQCIEACVTYAKDY